MVTVRQGNRAEIERAIEALGFQRSSVAKAMKSETTDVIGFLVPNFDEFHASLLNQLARLFRQSGRTMLTYCHDGDRKFLKETVGFSASQRVDALVLAGSGDISTEVEMLVNRSVPVTVYNNDVMGLMVDRVSVENGTASFRAVDHPISVGHRRITTVYGPQDESTGAQRLEGYCQAPKAYGIPVDPECMHPGARYEEGDYSAVQKFMSLDEPPTAIFSANYQMTIGILEWMREHGLRVPADLAVVSFDDVELFRLYDGGITAVMQPIGKIAESIASYVLSRLSGNELPDIRPRTLDCNIILRGSSGYMR